MKITNNKRIDRVITILAIATVLVGVALMTQYNRIRAGYYFTEGVTMALQAECYRVLEKNCFMGVGNKKDAEEAFKKAIEDYDEAIKLNSKFARAYYKRGQARLGQNQYKEALEDYNHAKELDCKCTKSADFYNELGLIYTYLEDVKTANDNYTRAIKINPNNAEYYSNRGGSYNLKTDYDEAIKDYTQAIKINPNNTMYYFKRGLSYRLKNDYDEAIKDYTQAIKINIINDVFYFERGKSYHLKQDYGKAIKDYTQAIKINFKEDDFYDFYFGKASKYYFYRGRSYHLNKDYGKAIKDYTQALQNGIIYNIGGLLEIDAQTKVLKVVKLFENSPAWKQGVKAGDKILLIDGKNTSNASLTEAINLLRGEAGTKVTLRIARQGRSDFDITLTRSQIITPEGAKIYYHRGNAKYKLGDKQGAIEDLQTFLRFFSEKRDAAIYKEAHELIRKLQQ